MKQARTNTQPRSGLRLAIGFAGCLFIVTGLAVEPLKPGKGDTIVVHADLAWEDPDESITYYRGNFELRTPDWSVEGGEATVYGPLNKPDRVLLSGDPARIWISQPQKSKVVAGSASQIEYLLTIDAVTFTGAAELRDGDNIITSELIRYDVEADSFSGGEGGRVKVSIAPESN